MGARAVESAQAVLCSLAVLCARKGAGYVVEGVLRVFRPCCKSGEDGGYVAEGVLGLALGGLVA